MSIPLHYLYIHDDLMEEYALVTGYVKRKAGYKNYNPEYLERIEPLIEKLYHSYFFSIDQKSLNHPIIKKAFEVAESCHLSQERKYTHSSYFVHLKEVAALLATIDNITPEQIAAGILHDVVEKGNVSLDYIKEQFGNVVHSYVYYLTDPIKEGLRSERISQNFAHFCQGPNEVHNIKMIDILSNTKSIIVCDAGFSIDYMKHMEYMNEFFQHSNYTDQNLKQLLQVVMDIGQELLSLQKQFNIIKLDKKKTDNNTTNISISSLKK